MNDDDRSRGDAVDRPRVDAEERVIPASPDRIYRALLDPAAVVQWLPPSGMVGELFEFEPRPGGSYRLRLTYRAAEHSTAGKSGDDFDEASGRFVELVPGERVVEEVEFASDDPDFAGTMRKTTSLTPVDGGTLVRIAMEDVPSGIDPADHSAGIASTLENLAAYLE